VKIDMFPHVMPRRYFDRLQELAPAGGHLIRRMREIPVLFDLDRRFEIMDRYPEYVQVLTLASPPLDEVVAPEVAVELARIANDEMAALVDRHPDRFLAFAATLPMSAPEAAAEELNRAVLSLGAAGAQVYTSVCGRPLDHPAFAPIFRRIAEFDLPVWLHPTRTATAVDYPSEQRSSYDIWWTFGWPYETSAAMTRLLFSGIFDRHPSLKIITHHCGGMIPYFEGRVGPGLDQLGTRTDDPGDASALARLSDRPLNYFKRFYADTALFGSSAGLDCGIAFFGCERVLFGTDMPFDPERGEGFIRETIAAIERTRTTPAERQSIFEDNARRLLRLPAATRQDA
jgi:predicted TIM-barrel fold metal-dependent hydrolase